CDGILIGSSPVGAGSSTSLSVVNCNSYQTPTFDWDEPSQGTTLPANSATPTFTAPAGICEEIEVEQTVEVSNGAGSNFYSTDITITPQNTLFGAVLIDT